MEMKIPAIAITVLVVITVLAGVLMPVLDDATAKTDTFSNVEGSMYYMIPLDAESEYTISYEAGASTFTANGESVARQNGTVVCRSGSWLIRDRGNTIQYASSSGNVTIGDSATSFDVTISGGTVVINHTGADTIEVSMTEGFAIASSGPYVMKSTDQDAYVLADSPIVAMGVTTLNGAWRNLFYIHGTINDISVDYVGTGYSVDNIEVYSESVSGHEGLYTISKITFDAILESDPTNVTPCTYTYFIVPAEVTAERTVHFSDNESAIFAAIPIMVIVALMIAVVALVFRGRNF